jgi:hypothetical protein
MIEDPRGRIGYDEAGQGPDGRAGAGIVQYRRRLALPSATAAG